MVTNNYVLNVIVQFYKHQRKLALKNMRARQKDEFGGIGRQSREKRKAQNQGKAKEEE
jgi:hypothetical protein